jgi:BirA family transcriptional regulator, biotin operon repressor / biotin---[acetyl-CoA-carboxylase] ligase
MAPSAPLTINDIRSTLATKTLGHALHLHQQLASTNTEAFALAENGAAHGTVVVAESQSAGHGRHRRVWFSPPGVNIYCSIVVRGIRLTMSTAEWLSWIPLTTALAVAESILRVTSIPLFLKWPNDLLLYDRKVGGILCESALMPGADPIVIIGIGLNVNLPPASFPEDLRPIATSLFEASQRPIDRNRLIAQLLLELEHCLDELQSQGSTRLRQAYTERCATIGRRVHILSGDGHEMTATAESIASDGALQVKPVPPRAQSAPLIDVRAADVIHLR